MKEHNNLIRVFTGSEITVNLLKDELEENEIQGIIKNDFNSGIVAGFATGTPYSVELLIKESDFKKAEQIIDEFIELNKG